jgi:pyridoxal phosphate enzyme (YggS family)
VSSIAARYEAVRRQVADAADCAGRSAADVTIVGVTKTIGIVEIQAAISAGMRDFGENRAQEFLGKYGLFPQVRWHFIGTLQTNKVKDVVGRAHLIHSIDSVHLLEAVDRKARGLGIVQPVLLQVNISGEDTKHGLVTHDVQSALEASSGLESVSVRGLMTMAPFGRPEEARPVFRELRQLAVSLGALRLNGVELDELSMGMTNDFKVAVEEGATIIRVGRAIFGR